MPPADLSGAWKGTLRQSLAGANDQGDQACACDADQTARVHEGHIYPRLVMPLQLKLWSPDLARFRSCILYSPSPFVAVRLSKYALRDAYFRAAGYSGELRIIGGRHSFRLRRYRWALQPGHARFLE